MKKRIKNKSAWRAALGYIGKYKLLLVLSLLLSACSVAATLYIPILVGGAIDDMLSMGAVLGKQRSSVDNKKQHNAYKAPKQS